MKQDPVVPGGSRSEAELSRSETVSREVGRADSSMTHDSSQPSQQAPKLTLSGEPSRIAQPSVFYNFSTKVVRTGAAESNVTFSIENKPAWASFGRRHGTLYGVPHPSDARTYTDIRITATDGDSVAHLQPFTLEVPAVSRRQ